jgi:hypothetical protein
MIYCLMGGIGTVYLFAVLAYERGFRHGRAEEKKQWGKWGRIWA